MLKLAFLANIIFIFTGCKPAWLSNTLKDASTFDQAVEVPLARLIDPARSEANKTPCTTFAVNGKVITAGHCVMWPEKIASITFAWDLDTATVSNATTLADRAFDDKLDYAVITPTQIPKTEKLFSVAEDLTKLPSELYSLGFPIDPSKASPMGTTNEERHKHFVTGTQVRVSATCSNLRVINETTISGVCVKDSSHTGPWAGFSGAPLFDKDLLVYGIFNSMSGSDTYFTRIDALKLPPTENKDQADINGIGGLRLKERDPSEINYVAEVSTASDIASVVLCEERVACTDTSLNVLKADYLGTLGDQKTYLVKGLPLKEGTRPTWAITAKDSTGKVSQVRVIEFQEAN